jgi:hypothetical protein
VAGINWWLLEQRDPPTPDDIDAAVAFVKQMPPAGDDDTVSAVLPVYAKPLPAVADSDWDQAQLKNVKLKKLSGHNAQLDRDNLIWHVQNPGQSKDGAGYPRVLKTDDGKVIMDGDHRVSALSILGVKKELCWVLDQDDLASAT